ncbi:MAG: DUF3726 domain-containing protein [Anderseniella sp.]|jgi:hypothetical protein|nr:DUF3726 domain-containing protein [Anderseniella sp.]
MHVSLNEVEVMATKAANGAGRPWGLAQEAGMAAARLEAMGLPGAGSLLGLLEATDGEADLRRRCPVLEGAHLCDLAGAGLPVSFDAMHEPLLLAPFLMQAGVAATISWPGCEVDVRADGLTVRGKAAGAGLPVTVHVAAGTGDAAQLKPQPGAVDIAGEIWEALGRFAHRTYVPATEASRLKGAGAGLTDND